MTATARAATLTPNVYANVMRLSPFGGALDLQNKANRIVSVTGS